jgi:hypothetical protein
MTIHLVQQQIKTKITSHILHIYHLWGLAQGSRVKTNFYVAVIQVHIWEYDNNPSAYLVCCVAVRTQEIGTVRATCHSLLLSLATSAQNGHTLDG